MGGLKRVGRGAPAWPTPSHATLAWPKPGALGKFRGIQELRRPLYSGRRNSVCPEMRFSASLLEHYKYATVDGFKC